MSVAAALIPSVPASPALDPAELRRQRGLLIAAICPIRREPPKNLYRVPSQAGRGHYIVQLDPYKGPDWLCSCADYEARKLPCKHIFAVQVVIEREKHADGSTTETQTVTLTNAERESLAPGTVAPRPTYRQNWAAYNAAQTTEKHRFQELLRDLCRGVPEPDRKVLRPKGGRPPIPMADRVFSCVFKVYSTFSGRRFMCDMGDAGTRGYVDQAPHFNSISRFLESPEMTPILGDLIAESALPLSAVEVDFAIDSSGFSSSKFVRWFDKKYGVVKEEHDWVKVHLMTGVKTNIVTAIRVGEQHSGDSPEFVPMLDATARRFAINEVSADAAYCSYDNFEAVEKHGGRAFIAFKSSATGAAGGVYEKMFHFYSLHRDEYLAHYHKRSNVESTFSMIKAKFGDAVRSRMHVAMVNEAMCKVLAHNLCCLVQSTHELGIEAKFWGREDRPAPVAEDDMIEAFAWM